MLNILRRKKGAWWIKVLLLGIAASFIVGFGAFMYIGRLLGKKAPEDVVIKVNDYEITVAEFYNNMRETERRYKELLGDNFEKFASREQLKNIVISQFVTRALLLSEAKRLGITVSDEQLRNSIASFKAFQDENGKFRLELYERVLARYNMTPSGFEEGHRTDLLVDNMRDFIQLLSFTSPTESIQSFMLLGDRVSLEFCSIDPQDFEAQVKLTDEEVADYFKKHTEEFKIPEKRVALHAQVEVEPFKKQVSLLDEDILSFYNEKQSELFTEQETVRARHILITVPPSASNDAENAARDIAESIRQRAIGGEDFAELAKKYSQDPANKEQGGDLGYFSRGDMVKQFEDVAFPLDVGQISEVFRTRYGLHIVKVEDKKPERIKSLEEVKDFIVATLTEKRADELAKAKADELAFGARTRGLDAAASELGYEAKKTEPVAATETASADGGQSFTRALFALEKVGDVAEPVKGLKSYEVLSLAEIIKEHIPTLEEVKDKVAEKIRVEKAANLAEEKAKQLLSRAREVGLEQAASEMNVAGDETELFSIRSPSIPKIGESVELKEDAFSAKPDELLPKIYRVGDKLVVAKLTERINTNLDDFRAVQYQLKMGLNAYKREELLRAWLEAARARAKIKIDEKALSQL